MNFRCLLAFAALLCLTRLSPAQAVSAEAAYSRLNTYTIFGEYSNDSSHIILGATPNRKLAGVGAQYERRILESRYLRWSYVAEFRPFIISSDPSANSTEYITYNGVTTGPLTGSGVVFQCVSGTQTFSVTGTFGSESGRVTTTCSRQLTIAQGGSPIGFRVNPLPRHPLQLTFSSDGGYMFSTKPIPIPQSGNFNFTFNFGGGLEYFYSPRHSVRLEYLVQHYSNHFTAPSNPGVDSGFLRVAYAFGR